MDIIYAGPFTSVLSTTSRAKRSNRSELIISYKNRYLNLQKISLPFVACCLCWCFRPYPLIPFSPLIRNETSDVFPGKVDKSVLNLHCDIIIIKCSKLLLYTAFVRFDLVKAAEVILCGWRGYKPSINKQTPL